MTENAEVSFYVVAPSLGTANQVIHAPLTGIISRVTITWPSGCNFLVEALFLKGRKQFIPEPTTGGTVGIRLNNFTETLSPNYPVTINDYIELLVINHDSGNDHAISAVMHIDAVETSEGAGEPLHAKGTKIID